ncbi:diacylglycerol/lipid kinase family protein [Parasphingorhabdus sp.]|uniref:diacylglycerol/lipid kinase family protein n=1 Tax=Parasphingorhabdus sp. TaxID=2709688 RepID=UPI003A923C7E
MKTNILPRDAILVINAGSRKGDDLFEEAKTKLGEAGINLIDAIDVDNPEDIRKIVRQAIKDAPMVIVGGGDGSLSGVVDEFVGTDCVFAILPLGTANSSARTLGVPLDLDGAIDVIAHGHRKPIDLGMIDEDYFVNAASLGLSPIIGPTVPQTLKRYLGRFGYLFWAMKCLIRFRPFKLIIDDGATQHILWSTEVRILNGPYHGGLELSDNARIDSGKIVIQAVVGKSKFKLGWDWYAKAFKLRDRNANTREFTGVSFQLTTIPELEISIDGEVLATTPVQVRIAAKAIEVAFP